MVMQEDSRSVRSVGESAPIGLVGLQEGRD